MTDATPTLTTIRRLLGDAQIEYVVVGSTVVGWLGHSRTTIDVDIVLNPSRDQLIRLVRALQAEDFYIDEPGAIDAFTRRSMINAIDQTTGWKIDLIMLRDDAYERSAFERRQPIETAAGVFPILTPEDLIISKLRWAKDSGSERQMRDVGGVFDIWRTKLDHEYLRRWADASDVRDVLDGLYQRPG